MFVAFEGQYYGKLLSKGVEDPEAGEKLNLHLGDKMKLALSLH